MPFGIGEYPQAYKPNVHGAYNPTINYALDPATKHISQVKLGELPKWLAQRKVDPTSMFKAVQRTSWRYSLRWTLCKRPGVAFIAQFLTGVAVVTYVDRWYPYLKYHKHTKYHW